jgi:hypothetical protein
MDQVIDALAQLEGAILEVFAYSKNKDIFDCLIGHLNSIGVLINQLASRVVAANCLLAIKHLSTSLAKLSDQVQLMMKQGLFSIHAEDDEQIIDLIKKFDDCECNLALLVKLNKLNFMKAGLRLRDVSGIAREDQLQDDEQDADGSEGSPEPVEVHCLRRFLGDYGSWNVGSKDNFEVITFSVDRDILMTGVGIGSPFKEDTVTEVSTLEIIEGRGTRGPIVYQYPDLICLVWEGSADDRYSKIDFSEPVYISRDTKYTFRIRYDTPGSVWAAGGKVIRSSLEVNFAFSSSICEKGDRDNNGNALTAGPIRDIYFSVAQEKQAGKKVKVESEIDRELLLRRFLGDYGSWSVGSMNTVEVITFLVDRDILMTGVGIGGPIEEDFESEVSGLEIRKGSGTRGPIVYQYPYSIGLRWDGADEAKFSKIDFSEPVYISRDVEYTFRIRYDTPGSVWAAGGSVNNAVGGVNFTFTIATCEGDDTSPSENAEYAGPIRDIYFTFAQEALNKR